MASNYFGKDDSDKRRVEDKLRRIEERRETDNREEGINTEWGSSSTARSQPSNNKSLIEKEAKTSTFIRTKEDATLNQRQKQVTRWDDPARHFVESMKEERSKFRPPPNRFDILPGKGWDGIDRSNGFERKYLQSIISKKTQEESSILEHYKEL